MQRCHGAGARDEPQERLRGRERAAAACHPPEATIGSLSSPMFFLFDLVFPPPRNLVPGFLIIRAHKQYRALDSEKLTTTSTRFSQSIVHV